MVPTAALWGEFLSLAAMRLLFPFPVAQTQTLPTKQRTGLAGRLNLLLLMVRSSQQLLPSPRGTKATTDWSLSWSPCHKANFVFRPFPATRPHASFWAEIHIPVFVKSKHDTAKTWLSSSFQPQHSKSKHVPPGSLTQLCGLPTQKIQVQDSRRGPKAPQNTMQNCTLWLHCPRPVLPLETAT